MFRAFFGMAAAAAILAFALAAPAGVAGAQEPEPASGTGEPVAEPAAEPDSEPVAEPAGTDGRPSDDEVRQLLSEESQTRFEQWKRRRGHFGPRECSQYDGVNGPTRPQDVYCGPDDVPDEAVQLYREQKRSEESTFINEPAIKF